MNLETLVLELVADDSKLSRDIDAAVRKAIKKLAMVERGSPIKPKVELDNLHELNELLDVKQNHLFETVSLFENNPIAVKVDTLSLEMARAEVAALQGELNGMSAIVKAEVTHKFEGQQESNRAIVNELRRNNLEAQKTNKELSKKDKNLLQSVGSGLASIATSPIKNVVRGFQEGIGITAAEKFFSGSIRSIEKQWNFTLDKIGEVSGNAFGSVGKVGAEAILRIFGTTSIEINQLFGDIQDNFNSIFDEKEAIDKINKIADALNRVVTKIATAGVMPDSELNDLSQTIKDYQSMGRKNREDIRAKAMRRTVAKAQSTGADVEPLDVSGKSKAVFYVPGFAGNSGQSDSSDSVAQLQAIYGESAKVIPVTNESIDTSVSMGDNPVRWTTEVVNRLTKLTGSDNPNDDVVKLLQQIVQLRAENPDIQIEIVGRSAGGFIAEQVVAGTKMMGIDGVKAVGLGTPSGIMPNSGSGDNYSAFMGSGDPIAKLVKAAGLIGLDGNQGVNLDVSSHSLIDYLADPKVQRRLMGDEFEPVDKNELIKSAATAKVKTINAQSKEFQDRFDVLSDDEKTQIASAMSNSIKDARQFIFNAMGEADDETQKLLKEIDKFYYDLQRQFAQHSNASNSNPQTGNRAKVVGQLGAMAVGAGIKQVATVAQSAIPVIQGAIPVMGNVAQGVGVGFGELSVSALNARNQSILVNQSVPKAMEYAQSYSVDSQGKPIVFSVGGVLGRGGIGGKVNRKIVSGFYGDQAKYVSHDTPNTDFKLKNAEDIELPKFMTLLPQSMQDMALMGMQAFHGVVAPSYGMIGRLPVKYATQGYNEDAVTLAGKMMAAQQQNPGVDVCALGHCGGGMVVQEAMAILEKANSQGMTGVAAGTANFPIIPLPSNGSFNRILGDEDFVGQSIGSALPWVQQGNTPDFGKIANISSHNLQDYLKHPSLLKSLPSDVRKIGINATLKSQETVIADYIKRIENGEANLQKYLSERINETKRFIDEVSADFDGSDFTNWLAKVESKLETMPVDGVNINDILSEPLNTPIQSIDTFVKKQNSINLPQKVSQINLPGVMEMPKYVPSTDIWDDNYAYPDFVNQAPIKPKTKRKVNQPNYVDPFTIANQSSKTTKTVSDGNQFASLVTINSNIYKEVAAIHALMANSNSSKSNKLSNKSDVIHGEFVDLPENNKLQKMLKGGGHHVGNAIQQLYGVASGLEQFVFDAVEVASLGFVNLGAAKKVTQTVAPGVMLGMAAHNNPMLGAGMDMLSSNVVTPLLTGGGGALLHGVAGLLPEGIANGASTIANIAGRIPGSGVIAQNAGMMGASAMGGLGTLLTYLGVGRGVAKGTQFALGQAVKPLGLLPGNGQGAQNATYNALTGTATVIGGMVGSVNQMRGLPPRPVEYVTAEIVPSEPIALPGKARLALPPSNSIDSIDSQLKNITQVVQDAIEDDNKELIESAYNRAKEIVSKLKGSSDKVNEVIKTGNLNFAKVYAQEIKIVSNLASNELKRITELLQSAGLNTNVGASGIKGQFNQLKSTVAGYGNRMEETALPKINRLEKNASYIDIPTLQQTLGAKAQELGFDETAASANNLMKALSNLEGLDLNQFFTVNGRLNKAGKEIMTGLIQGLQGEDGKLDSTITELAQSLPNQVKKILGIKSPSKVFEVEVGIPIGQGVEVGAVSSIQKANKTIQAEVAKIESVITKDIEYLKAVTTGDTVKAQAMVNDAAKMAGYNVGPVYHGTNAEFNEFDPAKNKRMRHGWGFYFTPKENYAKGYGENLKSVFLQGDNLEDSDFNEYIKETIKKIFESVDHNELAGYGKKIVETFPKTPDGREEAKARFAELKEQTKDYAHATAKPLLKGDKDNFIIEWKKADIDSMDIDAVRVLTGRLGMAEPVVHKGDLTFAENEIIAKRANQIKSADAFTKTDDGNPVPLSARFDDTVNDIRGNVNDIFAGLKSQAGEALQPLIAEFETQFAAMGDNSVQSLINSLGGLLGKLRGTGEEVGQTLKEFDTAIASITDELLSASHGQIDARIVTRNKNDQVLGTLDYSEYQGNPSIKHIAVAEEARRKGIATNMVKKLQSNYPDKEIDWGMMTDEGNKLKASIDKKAPVSIQDFEEYLLSKYKALEKLVLSEHRNAIKIDGIQVNKNNRSQGVGTQVIDEIKQFAAAKNLPIVLEASPEKGKKAKLEQFYKDQGFKKPGRNRNFELPSHSHVLNQIDNEYKDIGENAIDSLHTSVRDHLSGVENSGELIGESLAKGTEKNLEIASPSKRFARYGRFIIDGLISGINTTANKAYSTVRKVADGIQNAWDDVSLPLEIDDLSKKARSISGDIKQQSFNQSLTGFTNSVRGKGYKLVDKGANSINQVGNVNDNIFKVIDINAAKFSNKINDLPSQINQVANTVKQSITDSLNQLSQFNNDLLSGIDAGAKSFSDKASALPSQLKQVPTVVKKLNNKVWSVIDKGAQFLQTELFNFGENIKIRQVNKKLSEAGVTNLLPLPDSNLINIATQGTEKIKQGMSSLSSVNDSVWNGIDNLAATFSNNVTKAVGAIQSNVGSFISRLMNNAKETVDDVITGAKVTFGFTEKLTEDDVFKPNRPMRTRNNNGNATPEAMQEIIDMFDGNQPISNNSQNVKSGAGSTLQDIYQKAKTVLPILDDLENRFSSFFITVKKFGMLAVGGLGLALLAKGLFEVGKGALEAYRNMEGVFMAAKLLKGSDQYIADLRQQAIALGSDLQSTLEQGIQFSSALVGTPLETMAGEMFKDSSKALTLMGLQQQEYNSALLALKQVASKGRVSLEEITGQLGEAVPGIMPMVADALGTNVAGAIQQIESGNVLAEELLPKLIAGMENRTAGLAPVYERSLTAATGRVGTSLQDINIQLGQQLAPVVIPAINAVSDVLINLGQNIDGVVSGVKYLALALVGQMIPALVTLGKFIASSVQGFIAYNGITLQSVISTKTLASAMNLLNVAAKPLLLALAAISAFEVITFAFKEKGSQQVMDTIKDLDKTLALIDPEKTSNPTIKVDFISSGNGFLDWLDGVDRFTERLINKIPVLGKMFNDLIPDMSFGSQKFKGETQRVNELIQKANLANQKSANLGDSKAVGDYVAQLNDIDQQIAQLQGRMAALRMVDAQKNADEISSIQKQISGYFDNKGNMVGGLIQQRQDIENSFIPGGLDLRKRNLDALKATRDELTVTRNNLDATKMADEIKVLDDQIKELTKSIDVSEAQISMMESALKSLGNTLNAQRESFINLSGAIAQTQQNVTNAVNSYYVALGQQQLDIGLQDQVDQFNSLQLAVYEAEQQIQSLQYTLNQQKSFINSDVIDTKSRQNLEDLIGGKSLNDVTIQDVTKIKEFIANSNDIKQAVGDQLVGTLEEIATGNTRILEAQRGLIDSKKALAQFSRTQEDYFRDTARQVYDLNRQIEQQSIQDQRSIEDFGLQVAETSRQLRLSNRNLIESYQDLGADFNIQIETVQKSLEDAKDNIELSKLRTQNLSITPGNSNSAARQLNAMVLRFTESLFSNQTNERQIKIDVLNLEKERISRLRQVRQIEEQYIENVREYDNQVRQLNRSYVDLQRGLTDSTNNLRRAFEDLYRTITRNDKSSPESKALTNALGAKFNYSPNTAIPQGNNYGAKSSIIYNQATNQTTINNNNPGLWTDEMALPTQSFKGEVYVGDNGQVVYEPEYDTAKPVRSWEEMTQPQRRFNPSDYAPGDTRIFNGAMNANQNGGYILDQYTNAYGGLVNNASNPYQSQRVQQPNPQPKPTEVKPVSIQSTQSFNPISSQQIAKVGRAQLTANQAKELVATANKIGIDPITLLTIMLFETKGTLNPSITNSIGATGLIQFTPGTAKGLGTTTTALRGMTFEQQLPFVESYFKSRGFKPGMSDLEAYATVIGGNPRAKTAKDSNGTNAISGLQRMNNSHRSNAVQLMQNLGMVNGFNTVQSSLNFGIPEGIELGKTAQLGGLFEGVGNVFKSERHKLAEQFFLERYGQESVDIEKQEKTYNESIKALIDNDSNYWQEYLLKEFNDYVEKKQSSKTSSTPTKPPVTPPAISNPNHPDFTNRVNNQNQPPPRNQGVPKLESDMQQWNAPNTATPTPAATPKPQAIDYQPLTAQPFNLSTVKQQSFMGIINRELNPSQVQLQGFDASQVLPKPVQVNTDPVMQQANRLTALNQQLIQMRKAGIKQDNIEKFAQIIDDVTGFSIQLQRTVIETDRTINDQSLSILQMSRNAKGFLTIMESARQSGIDTFQNYTQQIRSIQDKQREIALFVAEKETIKATKQAAILQAQSQGLNTDLLQSEYDKIEALIDQYGAQSNILETQEQQLLATRDIAAANAFNNAYLEKQLNYLDKAASLMSSISGARYDLGGTLVNDGAIIQAKMALDTVQQRALVEAKTLGLTGQAQADFIAQSKELAEINYQKSFREAIPFIQELGANLKEAIFQTNDFTQAFTKLLDVMASQIFDQLVLKPVTNTLSQWTADIFGYSSPKTPTPENGGGFDAGSVFKAAATLTTDQQNPIAPFTESLNNATDIIPTMAKQMGVGLTAATGALTGFTNTSISMEQSALLQFVNALQIATQSLYQFAMQAGGGGLVDGLTNLFTGGFGSANAVTSFIPTSGYTGDTVQLPAFAMGTDEVDILNFAEGIDNVDILNFANGIDAVMAKEKAQTGQQPMLAVVNQGEAILSTLNGDAQKFRALKRTGVWDNIPSFANGTDRLYNDSRNYRGNWGMETMLPSLQTRQAISNQRNQVVNNFTQSYTVVTPNADSFRRSQSQIQDEGARVYRRKMR